MSYEPGDLIAAGMVSSCCGAPVYDFGICKDCKEHCGMEPIVVEAKEFSLAQSEVIDQMTADAEQEKESSKLAADEEDAIERWRYEQESAGS
jgi:hypothetical protein